MPVIDPTYLPFSKEELLPHFTADAEAQIKYFEDSALRYHHFLAEHPSPTGISLSKARLPRQLEKDERFWTTASLKGLFNHSNRQMLFADLLRSIFGEQPPVSGLSDWKACLEGELRLFFEAQLPSPKSYGTWLQANLGSRQMIPYILDGAKRAGTRPLEGPTHLDALLVNVSNGFALLIEAKVLSDISSHVSFDNFRNQLARNIDVMLERQGNLHEALNARDPARSLFILLTPRAFRDQPQSRLYGRLLREYQQQPEALARDLPHRHNVNWANLATRLGWMTFEDIDGLSPGLCPWLNGHKK